jgi:hypothetical protein
LRPGILSIIENILPEGNEIVRYAPGDLVDRSSLKARAVEVKDDPLSVAALYRKRFHRQWRGNESAALNSGETKYQRL